MTGVKSINNFVVFVDGKQHRFFHRSQMRLVGLDSENNSVRVRMVDNDDPIIVTPEDGMTAKELYNRFVEEMAKNT